MSTTLIGIIVILVIVAIVLFHFRKKIKTLKYSNVMLITGKVGGRKTSLSLSIAKKEYNKSLFKYYISKPIEALKKFIIEKIKHGTYDKKLKPMFYSNIPVSFHHNRLTLEIIERKVRIPDGSVVFIDEATLLCDSLMYKSTYMNDLLRNFVKLFRHYCGGTLVVNTQSYSDLHLAFKRALGTYIFISDAQTFPFVTICKVREMMAVDGESTMNTFGEDVEDSMKVLWFFNRIYKMYDSRCYSALTDNLEYQVDYKKSKGKIDLKCADILDLHDLYNVMLQKENKK